MADEILAVVCLPASSVQGECHFGGSSQGSLQITILWFPGSHGKCLSVGFAQTHVCAGKAGEASTPVSGDGQKYEPVLILITQRRIQEKMLWINISGIDKKEKEAIGFGRKVSSFLLKLLMSVCLSVCRRRFR